MSNRIFSKKAPVVIGTGSKAALDAFHAAMQRIASVRDAQVARRENAYRDKRTLLKP